MQVRRRIPLPDNSPRVPPIAAALAHNQANNQAARSRSSIRHSCRRSREWKYRLARVDRRTRRVTSFASLAPSQGQFAYSTTIPMLRSIDQTLPGPHPSKVDSLALTIRYPDIFPSDMIPSSSDLRLFSSGGGSELLEWDIARNIVRVCHSRIR